MPRVTTPSPAPPGARRGLTLLESLLAIALLALVATSISNLMGYVRGSQRRAQLELAAAEVANRVIIQYMDDKWTLMDQAGLPVGYGPDDDPLYFRWDLRVGSVRLDTSDTAKRAAADRQSPPNNVQAVEQVTVWVWLSEESGGSFQYDERVPSAVYTRLYAPLAGLQFRSVDSMNKLRDNDRAMSDLVSGLLSENVARWQTEPVQQTGGGGDGARGAGGRRP